MASHLHSHPASGPTISASRILDVQYETHALQSLYHSFPATHNPQHHSHNGGAGSSSASATSSSCGGGSGSSAEGGVTVTLMTADGSAQQGATNSLAWQGNVKLLKS